MVTDSYECDPEPRDPFGTRFEMKNEKRVQNMDKTTMNLWFKK